MILLLNQSPQMQSVGNPVSQHSREESNLLQSDAQQQRRREQRPQLLNPGRIDLSPCYESQSQHLHYTPTYYFSTESPLATSGAWLIAPSASAKPRIADTYKTVSCRLHACLDKMGNFHAWRVHRFTRVRSHGLYLACSDLFHLIFERTVERQRQKHS
jgi:hypothetical protein